MTHNRLGKFTLLTLAVAGMTAPALAQDSTGQIVGKVTTKKGAPIAGAKVRFSSPQLQGVRVLTTDEKGAYRAPLLPPGSYSITVSRDGYVGGTANNVILGLGQVLNQDLIMTPAQQAEAVVEVVAAEAAVDKADVKTATNISAGKLDQIPRTTRGMDTAALLAPGVATGVGGRVQIRGGQSTGNRFLLNGTDISDNVFGNTDGRSYYVDDSIAEIQVMQSPMNAKYGGFTGGVITALTKSGGNEFSGVFRANVNRASWSANPPMGLRQGVAAANGQPNLGGDDLNRTYTLWVGGAILKDKLWFAASTILSPAINTPQNLNSVAGLTTGDGSGAAAYVPATNGAPFTRVDAQQFYELKLTWAVNPNHTVDLSGNRSTVEQQNRFYVASPEPGTLVPQTNGNEYMTLGYRGLIGTNFTIESRAAYKKQYLSAGANPANGDPIRARYSNGTYYQMNNGIFDKTDGGDVRRIYTYATNATWFSDDTFMGRHTVDMGFELLAQRRQSANSQSPTGRQFFVWGRNADGTYRVSGTGGVAQGQNNVALYTVDKGTAKTDINALYINDTLAINNNLQVLLGLRYDEVKAGDTLGSQTIKSSQLSPRSQVRWDIKGDQSWLVTASWARYTGKLTDGFTNRFTQAGNPITEFYIWGGAANNAATLAQITNIANWNVSAAGLVSYSGTGNRFVDKSTKAPAADETSLGIRRSYKDGSFLSFNYSQRKTRHFYNDIFNIGDETTITARYSTGTVPFVAERWITDERLKRDYKSFEVEFMNRFDTRWSLGGNYTYAILKGNGEGSEGNNPPVSGDVIGDYDSVHASRGRGVEVYAPYGFLTGDVKHRARISLDYANKTPQGTGFSWSLLFNYNGGGTYSLTRGLGFEAQTDATAAGSTAAFRYPATYTRFYGDRGIGRFNDTFGFDMKVGLDVAVTGKVRSFVELTVFNLFNHWQLASYDTTGVSGTALATSSPLAGYRAAGVTTSAQGNQTGFGTYGFGNYTGGRSMALSAGFKW
jgi:hypothetical protein